MPPHSMPNCSIAALDIFLRYAENRVSQFGEGRLFLRVPWMKHYTLNELPHPQVDFT
jgi:hypothetical protein